MVEPCSKGLDAVTETLRNESSTIHDDRIFLVYGSVAVAWFGKMIVDGACGGVEILPASLRGAIDGDQVQGDIALRNRLVGDQGQLWGCA